MKSNEFEMEPLILSLKPGASYKHFDPSESDTFIYCLKGCVTLTLEIHDIRQMNKMFYILGLMKYINYIMKQPMKLKF